MITRERIERLAAFDGRGALVLSLYLDLDSARRTSRSPGVVLEELARSARGALDGPAGEAMAGEMARAQRWLDDREPEGQALSLFSCAARALWEIHLLALPLPDHLAFEPRPDVAPLLALVHGHERYEVALVDKRRARLFTVFLGEIEEAAAFDDHTHSKLHQGERHVPWHFKRVAQQLKVLLDQRRFDRLVVAGPDEATSELRHLLPRALVARLAAVLHADLQAGPRAILRRTLEVERRMEEESERHLADELLEAAGAGARATSGPEPTLEALWRGAVRTLVVADGARMAGGECPVCGWLAPGTGLPCPECGSEMRPVPDLLHRAMDRAVEQGGKVEVVHGDSAGRLLDAGSGLAALLRYL